jgi:hypothetical protein
MMLNSNDMQKAKDIRDGLQQFEQWHMPKREANKEDATLVCGTCDVDFPCERMLTFMLLQGIASLTAMIPTGNMAGVMQRFMGGKQ